METGPLSLRSVTPTIDIYVRLAQYPILSDRIRVRMREELFRQGIISQAEFEREVKDLAVESQRREGLHDPFSQEDDQIWQRRTDRIRDFHTDAYFANNLGSTALEQIIEEVLSNQPLPARSVEMTFNPEIAPWELLFRQGEIYESMPLPERQKESHHLEELKVVLLKRLVSDDLPFIGVAKQFLSIADLRWIYRRRIGSGKIGGKAGGMVLAWKILQQTDPELGPDISQAVEMPDSYFIGSDVLYEFNLMNKLDDFLNQKYRPLAEMQAEYPHIVAGYMKGQFPDNIVEQLGRYLEQIGHMPLKVRSSSLLEDNFTYSFSGKYNSFFCPNQGTHEENLAVLLNAIRRVYASTFKPEAMMVRQKYGLLDYDERMAILLQQLQGRQYGRYFLPPVAGVGLSQNPFRWHPDIRPDDGCLRIVWGFGTRTVEQSTDEQARVIALSHPQLRPEKTADAIRQTSQAFVDVIDLKGNDFQTLPIQEMLQADYPDLRYIASMDEGQALREIRPQDTLSKSDRFVLTFNRLVKDRKLVKLLRTALRRLENAYGTPVEMEFALEFRLNYPQPEYRLYILQCRPLVGGAKDETAVP